MMYELNQPFDNIVLNLCDRYNLKNYFSYINECRVKCYDNCIMHKHHIIPRHMQNLIKNFSVDNKSNIINISSYDHYQAHWILANCFKSDHIFHYLNLCACSLLFEWAHNPDECRNSISNSRIGKYFKSIESTKKHSEFMKGNTFRTGILHDEKTKKLISEHSKLNNKKRWPIPNGIYECTIIINNKVQKFYRLCTNCNKEIYYTSIGTARLAHKNARKCKICTGRGRKFSPEHINKIKVALTGRSQNNVQYKDRHGGNNSNSKKVMIVQDDIILNTISEACIYLNVTYSKFKRLIKNNDNIKIMGYIK